MAEAIVGVLFENLNSLIQKEFGLVWGVQAEMKKLSSKLSAIQAVLEDAATQQIKSKGVGDWLNKLQDAAYDADDILDEWAIEHLFLQPTESEDDHLSKHGCTANLPQVPCNSFSSCFDFKRLVFRYKIAKKMKEIRERFDDIAKEKSDFHLKEVGMVEGVVTLNTYHTQNRETSCVGKEPKICGREADKETLVKQLLEDFNNEKDVCVLPILGIGGLGKTTLAQLIYKDERVIKHFDHRIWVCVSGDFDVKRLSKAIIESSSEEPCNLNTLSCIQEKLLVRLKGKRFLLVLDDVWTEKQDEWHLLKNSLTSGAKGSSIIITTRLQTVAFITGTAPAYKLNLLSQHDCWSLFSNYAFGIGNEEKPSLVNIGQEIVKKCGGIPLAAKALGSLLRYKSEEKQWELIRDSEIWNLETTILPALRLSYNNLSPHSRQCFAYCSLFPKNYEMGREILIHLWMANGLLQSEGRMQPEDIGEAVFSELLLHSFFQGRDHNDYLTGWKIHDLLHDLASSVMKNSFSTVELRETTLNVPKKAQHLSVVLPSSIESLDIDDLEPSSQPNPRTLLFLIPSRSNFKGLSVHHMSIVSHLTCLRTLCLKDAKVTTLPLSIGNLKHLRYLNLDNCRIESLPESFCRLRNLQTLSLSGNVLVALPASMVYLQQLRYLNLFNSKRLTSLPESISNLTSLQNLIIKDSSKLKELPKKISKICSLRHLNIDGCSSLNNMPIGIGSLTNLETLGLFVLSQDSGRDGGIEELHGLNLLKGLLQIDGLQHLRNSMDAKGANLKSKQYILSLALNWSGNSGDSKSSKEVLKCLQPHHNIERLHISGYPGSEFPTWMEMSDPLSFYPRLIEIKLRGMHNLGEWSLNWKENERFPPLQNLSLFDCKQLKVLPTRLCDLRSLRRLTIQGCEELLSLPQDLGKVTSLEYLHIQGCDSLTSMPQMGIHGLNCSLEVLHINDCKNLSFLSKGLRHLTSLKSLSIERCPQLKFSETDFEHLFSLQVLKIKQLSLTSLPESITNMNDLQELTVRNCDKLIRWPNGMDKLTSLRFLEVEDCEYLRELPECLNNVFAKFQISDRNCMYYVRLKHLQYCKHLPSFSI